MNGRSAAVTGRGHSARVLLNVGEDAVELVETVIGHDDFALARARVLDRDLRSQLFGQLLFQA